jgi:hypothetical protein
MYLAAIMCLSEMALTGNVTNKMDTIRTTSRRRPTITMRPPSKYCCFQYTVSTCFIYACNHAHTSIQAVSVKCQHTEVCRWRNACFAMALCLSGLFLRYHYSVLFAGIWPNSTVRTSWPTCCTTSPTNLLSSGKTSAQQVVQLVGRWSCQSTASWLSGVYQPTSCTISSCLVHQKRACWPTSCRLVGQLVRIVEFGQYKAPDRATIPFEAIFQ